MLLKCFVHEVAYFIFHVCYFWAILHQMFEHGGSLYIFLSFYLYSSYRQFKWEQLKVLRITHCSNRKSVLNLFTCWLLLLSVCLSIYSICLSMYCKSRIVVDNQTKCLNCKYNGICENEKNKRVSPLKMWKKSNPIKS